ncbi:Rtr1/RPAP2 family protein phosphatase [Escherichia coli]|uniref:Rtr1/RPAP2 family protein phosphatase n=1 Tax=Escherichia coli TaxID=562 RepID=UPI001FF4CB60|nr:Rtr1/RPAP2 family protein phosphatase [Escherichia coli]MDZ3964946.1 Rtr1/RPAP2 family protein phosphatase [Escherichia coli]
MTKKIKCAYHLCNKEIEESKIITRPLHFMHGVIPTTEMKKYCSEICAEKDQMAHEL